MKKITYTCDMCGKEWEGCMFDIGGVTLTGIAIKEEKIPAPYLTHHFCGSKCFWQWVRKHVMHKT